MTRVMTARAMHKLASYPTWWSQGFYTSNSSPVTSSSALFRHELTQALIVAGMVAAEVSVLSGAGIVTSSRRQHASVLRMRLVAERSWAEAPRGPRHWRASRSNATATRRSIRPSVPQRSMMLRSGLTPLTFAQFVSSKTRMSGSIVRDLSGRLRGRTSGGAPFRDRQGRDRIGMSETTLFETRIP